MLNETMVNLTLDEVLEVIKDFPVQPYRNRLIVTSNTTVPDFEEGADFSQIRFNENQYVVAVGKSVIDITPGMKVILDLEKMMVTRPSDVNSEETTGFLKLDPIDVGNRTYIMISDVYVKAIDKRDE